ncbi:MAG: hypothetical protein ABSE89_01325 [Sedimentisphaerales bacterium]
MKKLLSKFRGRRISAEAFSLVELEVTLVILAIGLFGFAGLFKVYSQQISFIERYSEPNMYVNNPEEEAIEFWLVSQSNQWMRQIGAPAAISKSAGQTAWTPPVDGNDIGQYTVTMTSTPVKNFALNKAVVNIKVVKN